MASRWILEEFPSEAEEIIEQQRYVTLIILGPALVFPKFVSRAMPQDL